MKKALLVIFVAMLLVMALPTTILAESDSESYKSTETYKLLEEFVTLHPDRSKMETERQAADYILNKFNSYGYNAELQRVPFDAYGYETNNVVAFLDSATATDCIVIGAHYDAIGAGANDNASGVVALLQIAQKLKNANLSVDVYFVAFGGEEQGLYGSKYFVQKFSQKYLRPLNNIRVMFNMDCIANGDNLYVHCENKQTELANLVLQNKSGGCNLLEKPYAVGVFNADAWGYGYFEDIQGSDHTPFRLEGVPVANFFSGNFKNWGYVESVNPQNNTMNSAMDKLENCNQSWIDKIDAVVGTVVATVSNSQFDSVSINARNELLNLDLWYNRLWPKLIAGAIVILLAVLALLYNRKLQKQALMGTAEAKTTRIFETPSADDIFTFKD